MNTELRHQEMAAANSTFAIGGVSFSVDSIVVTESSVLQMNICTEKPAHRKSANRYAKLLSTMINKYIILFLVIGLSTSCKKDDIDIKKAEANSYVKYNWEPVLDSLDGEYFTGLDISQNGQLYVNYWKGWNGMGPTLSPATLISDDGINWRRVGKDQPIDGTWTYLQRHKETIFAGTPREGFFSSLDNGQNWTISAGSGWLWPKIIKSNNKQIIISDFDKGKTFISDDDAATWREIFPRYEEAIDLQTDKIVILSRGRIIESTDWGYNWKHDSSLVVQEKENLNLIGIGSINNQTIVAANSGVFIKRVDGQSWTNISQTILNKAIGCMMIDEDKIIIQTNEDNFGRGFFYFSNDLGKTWLEFNQGLNEYLVKHDRADKIIKKDNYLYMANSNGFFKRKVD